jgi:DNA-binding CsgD family transcriptional regulator
MIIEHDLASDPLPEALPREGSAGAGSVSSAMWDAALGHAGLDDLLASPENRLAVAAASIARAPSSTAASAPDSQLTASGFAQLNKYLNKAWYRSGLPVQVHDDSTQAVYTTLLQAVGRQRFDRLVGDIGHSGIRDTLSRETSEGVSFFRAVDMVKKRAMREKVHQSLDSVDVPAEPARRRGTDAMRAALRDAMDQTLSPREAALINDTMMGKTPAEIALEWGVAPKTVSNEKARVLAKLREALIDHELN